MANEVSQRPHRPLARTRRISLVLAGVVSLAASAGSAFAIATIRHVEHTVVKIRVDPGGRCTSQDCLPVTPQCANKRCVFLVLGSDSRKGVPKKFGTTTNSPGQRSDTIILVQTDPTNHRTTVLSIPRDLRVNIPGHGLGKINTAFNYGPNTMVRTVEGLTGLRINHYVEVNFLGFEGVVNALGGVPICINRPLKDVLAGLDLPRAGCYNLNGRQALAFVRARHIQGDLIPDFSRIARQQQFIRALISKVLSAGSLLRIGQFIKAVQDNLRLDANLNLYALQDLTRTLGEVGQRGVLFRIVPSVPVTINGADYVALVQPQAGYLFARLREGRAPGRLGIAAPLTRISPANVTVRVLDSGASAAAQQVVEYLQRAGFVVLPLKPAPAGLDNSAILWRQVSITQKEVVASYLTLVPPRKDLQHTSGDVVTVVIAPDFQGIEGT
jgi:LCP family protein required for cell wall assembly